MSGPRSITQEQLRLFSLCSERYFLSDSKEDLVNPKLRAIEKAFEYLIVQNLDGYPFKEKTNQELYDRAMLWLNRNISLTQTEYQDTVLKGSALFHSFINEISFDKYIPVFGPYMQSVKLKELILQIHFSALARTPVGALRSWVFSPYEYERDILFDPIHRVQYEILSKLSKEQKTLNPRFSPILYIIYIYKNNIKITSIDKIESKTKYKNRLEVLEKQIIESHHYSLLPCNYSNCPYRKECNYS